MVYYYTKRCISTHREITWLVMEFNFKKPKDLRYQILLDDESSDYLEILKIYFEREEYKTGKNGVVIKALKDLFKRELKNQGIKIAFEQFKQEKKAKVLPFPNA